MTKEELLDLILDSLHLDSESAKVSISMINLQARVAERAELET